MGESLSAPGRSPESPARALKRTVKLGLRLVTKGWYTEQRLRRDLEALGVRSGRVLLVHSSLSSLGVVSGGAATVIDALRALLGPEGTLVMPSHTWDRPGRGDFAFDIGKTPSCVGAISEKFRTMPGAIRSLHPTHSVVALGPKAGSSIPRAMAWKGGSDVIGGDSPIGAGSADGYRRYADRARTLAARGTRGVARSPCGRSRGDSGYWSPGRLVRSHCAAVVRRRCGRRKRSLMVSLRRATAEDGADLCTQCRATPTGRR